MDCRAALAVTKIGARSDENLRSAAIKGFVVASAARPSMTANSGPWTAALRSQ